jgi:acyl-CoA reductase-like NAD-dependent aldehyde dehydrogenase
MYIFTKNQHKIDRLMNETSSGALTINDMIKHFAIPTLPFGGVGQSGIGFYHGKHGFDTFTHKKAVLNCLIDRFYQ